eukprot:661273-Pyramimonas_sp.AAC.1
MYAGSATTTASTAPRALRPPMISGHVSTSAARGFGSPHDPPAAHEWNDPTAKRKQPSRRPSEHRPSKPRSRLSAGQWQSTGREYTSNIRWNIRNAVR